jgi:hypothetical protein
MTLIIKELIIKGVVTDTDSKQTVDSMDKEMLLKYLEQMQKELKSDCVEAVLSKLKSNSSR